MEHLAAAVVVDDPGPGLAAVAVDLVPLGTADADDRARQYIGAGAPELETMANGAVTLALFGDLKRAQAQGRVVVDPQAGTPITHTHDLIGPQVVLGVTSEEHAMAALVTTLG